ncbi:Acyltransferase-like protein [Apostasia shenzhenica]|uniref:Acyltransferase-like protein n=1 Tax=Apostasia shenzhenica TaxID=1088818 RepID=A0A2I0APL3_9ASPA|nr:Acyltransferase-like protein [Apostasia shenzhenica]
MALSFSLPSSYLFPRSFNFPTRFRAAAVTGEQSAHFLQAPGKVVVRNGESGMDLEVLYDDGSGTLSVKDYLDAAREIIRPDGGPPRWFCPPECGQPIKDAPLLLFLPGIDGTGFGLILHHKSLGRVFEVRCLHVPVSNRSPFEELVGFVEHSVKFESRLSPNKPIYLVGDSFGGCLALAVAARNPEIDLVLVLVNPASSFGKSQLQPFLPLMEALPSNFHFALPYVLSFVMGDPVKMAMASVIDGLPPQQTLDVLLKSLTSLLPMLSDLAEIIPKETLVWKLLLLKKASAYVNSRLHAIKAAVLVLSSGKDNLLPSGDEADRLWSSLENCRVRYFKDSGHTLLLEDGINLLTIIKGVNMYRRSRQIDFVEDYLPPTLEEFKRTFEQENRLFHLAMSPVMLSTLSDGTIVKGLSGVPNEGPVLLVGYHMLMGLELTPFYEGFLREKRIIIRGMAHPFLFGSVRETSRQEISQLDAMSVFGALPVTPRNLYRLFSKKSFVLLYPGGAREALHLKRNCSTYKSMMVLRARKVNNHFNKSFIFDGEQYKLFWPEQPEFVRMAARFDVTIVPFGVVGEDDIAENLSSPFGSLTATLCGSENAENSQALNQELYLPGLLPKIPGRFYYCFGKPIEMHGMKHIISDRECAIALYLQIKSEIENMITYLKRKREEDPFRSIFPRIIYQTSWGVEFVPTFEP